jgi:hypothetical protein
MGSAAAGRGHAEGGTSDAHRQLVTAPEQIRASAPGLVDTFGPHHHARQRGPRPTPSARIHSHPPPVRLRLNLTARLASPCALRCSTPPPEPSPSRPPPARSATCPCHWPRAALAPRRPPYRVLFRWAPVQQSNIVDARKQRFGPPSFENDRERRAWDCYSAKRATRRGVAGDQLALPTRKKSQDGRVGARCLGRRRGETRPSDSKTVRLFLPATPPPPGPLASALWTRRSGPAG